MYVPTDQMYRIEMKGLISGPKNPRSVFRARATASCPQDIWGDMSTARIEWWYFRVNRIRAHGVTVLRHLGILWARQTRHRGCRPTKGSPWLVGGDTCGTWARDIHLDNVGGITG